MNDNQYKCGLCKQIFDRVTPDEEALAECDAIFGVLPKSELAMVCDDCWNLMNEIEPFANQPKPLVAT